MHRLTTLACGLALAATPLLSRAADHGQHRSPERQQRFMDRWDTNSDGVISDEERAAARAHLVAVADTDGDGEVSQDERRAHFAKMQGERGNRHAKVLEQWDTDGDGKLSKEERDARRKEMLEKADTDGDGQISEAERTAFRQSCRAEKE